MADSLPVDMPPEPSPLLRHVRRRPFRKALAPRASSPIAALWRLREYLRAEIWKLAVMLAAAIIAVCAEIAIPLFIKAVIDGPIRLGDRGALVPLGLATTALGVTQAVLSFYRRWIQAHAITELERRMRDDIYAHLQRLHAGFHDEWQSGQLLSRATTDLSTIRRFAGFGLVFFITNIVTFVVVVVLLVRLNWWLGLLTGLVFMPVLALCLKFERRYRVLSRRAQDQEGDLATYVGESAAGIRVLKALGRRDEAALRHRRQASRVYTTQVAKARLRGTFWAGLDLVPNAVIGLILLLGALAVGRGTLTLGGLVAFITLTLQLVWPIEAMGYILASGQEAATAAQRVYELLDAKPAITDLAGPTARPLRGPGRLVFDRVSFRYPGATHPVIDGLSLEIAPGETVALVGGTGSGKTTLLALVPRLADVTGGTILLDGTDIRQIPIANLRAAVGCAFEDPTLFSASVRENVSLGVPDATDEKILAALEAAQAGFVASLPWGLDTRIGEQGMSLSGGQRQRIALARAILTRPSVLLLDDPLSALDVHTEAKVTAALRGLLGTSTTLIVAHRPSTVLLADRVALLDGGAVAALDSHRNLLRREPRYRALMSAGPGADGDLGTGHDLTGARR
jgi:ATP-binding cassette subfamily B protein